MGITREQALDCFRSDDLIGIGMEADAVRRTLHPEGVVSYLIDRRIELKPSDDMLAAVLQEVHEAVEMGGTGVTLVDASPLGLPLDTLEFLLTEIRQRHPHLWLHGLSATTILAFATPTNLPEILTRLKQAGLNSITGDDAIILDDAARTLYAHPVCNAAEWLRFHRTAHQLGLRTSASMLFGFGETLEQRVAHLVALRALQEETGGFSSFTASAYVPDAKHRAQGLEEPTSVESLKTLAIARMVLDNIENIQTEASTHGLKVLQMSLRFGSNDAGSVLSASGIGATEEELRRIIRDAGFKPVQRDTLYQTMFLN